MKRAPDWMVACAETPASRVWGQGVGPRERKKKRVSAFEAPTQLFALSKHSPLARPLLPLPARARPERCVPRPHRQPRTVSVAVGRPFGDPGRHAGAAARMPQLLRFSRARRRPPPPPDTHFPSAHDSRDHPVSILPGPGRTAARVHAPLNGRASTSHSPTSFRARKKPLICCHWPPAARLRRCRRRTGE